MKRSDFGKFKEVIKNADNNDPIWWAGYLWLDLTENQYNKAYDILIDKGFPVNESGFVKMPSGFIFKGTHIAD